LRDLPSGQRLLQKEGQHKNRFAFPFGNFAVLSNITSKQLSSMNAGDATEVFPLNKVVLRDRLVEWDEGGVEGDALLDTLRGFFDPFWEIDPLREEQIAVLRAAIHPEVVISQAMAPQKEKPVANAVDLKVLDLRQENNARRIGDGHRIIFGVAGSGKTVLLIAKARLFATQQPESNLLMLCYNVSLASFLKQALRDCPKVKVYHFDGWAKENRIVRREIAPHQLEDNESLGTRLLAKLESGQALHSRYFDLVMVDEAQDFELNWFSCVLAAMQDPNDGDLIIVGDGSQSLYGNRKVSWKSIGIQAQGRTILKTSTLTKTIAIHGRLRSWQQSLQV
ncbi:MAG: AAA family ATPase, partial [Synechococcaceae cyanobacterium SM2_3_1]|nr:AAA family ATPase [Synechococcaceae cyanobacterium SM2_3_1]